MEILEDTYGNEVVFITNEDGTTLSMTKAHWDKLEAEREQSGTL